MDGQSELERARDRCVNKTFFLLLISALMAGFIAFKIQPGYRVLSDETNLLSTARSLWQGRGTAMCTMQIRLADGGERCLEYYPTRRPLLFPALVAVIHFISGYRIENAFGLNLFLLILLFWTLSSRIGKKHGVWLGISAALLVLSHPITSITATSAGFDLLNLLLLAGVVLSGNVLLKGRGSIRSHLLVVTLLPHVRYEGVVYFGIAILHLLWNRLIRWQEMRRHPLWTFLVIAITIPAVAQRVIYWSAHDTSSSPFRMEFLMRNLGHLVDVAIGRHNEVPWAWPLFPIAAVVAIALSRGRRQIPGIAVFWGALLGAHLLITLPYYNADPLSPIGPRLYLPFLASLSVFVVFGIFALGVSERLIASFSLLVFLVYLPVAQRHRHADLSISIREERLVTNYLKEQAPDFLLVIPRSNHFTVRGWAAIDPQTFIRGLENPKILEGSIHRRVLVAQIISKRSGVHPRYSLPPDVDLVPIAEWPFEEEAIFRISRVAAPLLHF